jgi:3-oxoacyl-[acyl-carrier-protein] synthase II
MKASVGWSDDAVVATGLGIYCSIGRNVDEFCASLLEGRKGFSRVSHFAPFGFRNDRAGVVIDVPTRATSTGLRENALLRSAVEQALAESRVEHVDGQRVAVAIGTSLGGFGGFVHWLLSAANDMPDPNHVFKSELNPGNLLRGRDAVLNIPPVQLAGELAREYGFSAGISAACTACSAGANSLAIAVDSLRRGRADVVVAGGVDPINEMTVMGFNALMAISPSEPSPFDRNRSGLLVGEGAGILVLERRSHARAGWRTTPITSPSLIRTARVRSWPCARR